MRLPSSFIVCELLHFLLLMSCTSTIIFISMTAIALPLSLLKHSRSHRQVIPALHPVKKVNVDFKLWTYTEE